MPFNDHLCFKLICVDLCHHNILLIVQMGAIYRHNRRRRRRRGRCRIQAAPVLFSSSIHIVVCS